MTDKKSKWLVMGGMMEKMAHLDVLATDEEDAIRQWREHFGNLIHDGWHVEATSLLARPDMTRFWTEEGHSHYSGGYSNDWDF